MCSWNLFQRGKKSHFSFAWVGLQLSNLCLLVGWLVFISRISQNLRKEVSKKSLVKDGTQWRIDPIHFWCGSGQRNRSRTIFVSFAGDKSWLIEKIRCIKVAYIYEYNLLQSITFSVFPQTNGDYDSVRSVCWVYIVVQRLWLVSNWNLGLSSLILDKGWSN